MIRKFHNHKLQTNPWHRKSHNNHETSERQTKQSNKLSLLHQDDCETRMDTEQRTTKTEQPQNPIMRVTINNELKTITEPLT